MVVSIICAKAFSLPTYTPPRSILCYRDMRRHYGAVPPPRRVGHPDRKEKPESGGMPGKRRSRACALKLLRRRKRDHAEERWGRRRFGTVSLRVRRLKTPETDRIARAAVGSLYRRDPPKVSR